MTPEKPETNAPPGWNLARPRKLARPTFWPAALALAITLLFWSLVTSRVIALVGIILFAAALAGWIREICHERKEP